MFLQVLIFVLMDRYCERCRGTYAAFLKDKRKVLDVLVLIFGLAFGKQVLSCVGSCDKVSIIFYQTFSFTS